MTPRRRWLRPALGAVSFAWTALVLRTWLTSGQAFPTAAAVAWLVWWAAIFALPTIGEQDVTDGTVVRRSALRRVALHGTFTAVFLGLVIWAATLFEFTAVWVVPVAIAAVLLAVNLAIWLNADRLSARAREQRAASPSPSSG